MGRIGYGRSKYDFSIEILMFENGMRQQFDQGQRLRKRYIEDGLLNAKYSRYEVEFLENLRGNIHRSV